MSRKRELEYKRAFCKIQILAKNIRRGADALPGLQGRTGERGDEPYAAGPPRRTKKKKGKIVRYLHIDQT